MLIEEEDAQSEKKPLQEWLLLFSAYNYSEVVRGRHI